VGGGGMGLRPDTGVEVGAQIVFLSRLHLHRHLHPGQCVSVSVSVSVSVLVLASVSVVEHGLQPVCVLLTLARAGGGGARTHFLSS